MIVKREIFFILQPQPYPRAFPHLYLSERTALKDTGINLLFTNENIQLGHLLETYSVDSKFDNTI
ncbi:hypothetical protein Avbf_18226 [Armadillidium vulgare]|nr:hypothetical protein Avbf_18226 [Armadillidium vulgare]